MFTVTTSAPTTPLVFPTRPSHWTVQPLTRDDEAEVLAFLARRPIHTVILAGMIRDNGLVSPLNRGSFYAYRDRAGRLQGVALIGHVIMIETSSNTALELFAQLAQERQHAHVIVGEQDKVNRFWRYYSPAGQPPRLMTSMALFEQRQPAELHDSVKLRKATLCDIETLIPVHARMTFEECGVDPMLRDPLGYLQRVARRIRQGRVWLLKEQDRLIFKADVVSFTPEQVYIEGVYVAPEERGKGQAGRFISQLGQRLLAETKSVCLLVKEENQRAQACYRHAGYAERGYYDTIYLQQRV
jgi:uncharacterized protein